MGVHGILQTGTYTISNVATTKYVTLANDNKGSPLFEGNDKDDDNAKWNVVKLSNGKYTIQSYKWIACWPFACPAPRKGDAVKVKFDSFQWEIREAKTENNYFIFPGDDLSLWWGFSCETDGINVTLTDSVYGKGQWHFNLVTVC
ncbi:hypothetical protein BV22DRAFT_1033653 [Leucogyrophana mollusca]|uniref:Uncharacterized protein n=1 Tax=Leucogyrophana mollusca TaxID=85980 RepID=A0ACB8BIP8_9AGAM|nr:hypothetical protein BV22DRAFT_1033653 [Leucogyrophana mollusca]